ncbi:ATPase [Thermococcus sp. EP1]|uniref:ATP-binding protein n=1 Tax=Thermococcus sp. EP1 TaxID=1591054 RepID=UPI0006DA98A6|nr:Flp pilus assembly complex ATPase component TadA [Thermococcus sp. EP1]KPU62432.1 ATPase [Thermococcus sp. EP1]
MGVYIFTPEDLLRYGTISKHQLEIIRESISKREDILVVGTSRSGKTKLIEAMIHLIPDDWKIAVITAYGEFKPFKENIHVIDTEFNEKSTKQRTKDVIKKIKEFNPDYVIIDTLHTIDIPYLLDKIIDDYPFIISSLVLSRDLLDEIKHWLRIDDNTLARFELLIELYRDIKSGLRRVNTIYRIVQKEGRIELEKAA